MCALLNSQKTDNISIMEISELGEFGLIDRLTAGLENINPSTVKGVGDDCAVLRNHDTDVLVTTDLLLEGVHFDLTYVPLKHLGYKSAVVNFSDVYGEAPADKVVSRSGAKDTDLICVSGDLGAAYMGLQLLEREKIASAGQKEFIPRFEGKEYLVERQLKPEARRDIIEELAKAGIVPTAMMDISDGLSSELLHICKQSDVGCRVYEDRIPIDYQTAIMAEELGMNLVTAALNGGEDYELLFTVPLHCHEQIEKLPGVKLIGHITKPSLGCALITRDGNEISLRAQGWNPLSAESV